MIGTVALFLVVLILSKGAILDALADLDPKYGPLAGAAIFLLPPLLGLASVGPFVVKLSTRDLDRVGVTVGRVTAVSTLGSVLGTISTGYVLIPEIGVDRSLVGIAALLAALSCLGLVLSRRRTEGIGVAILVAMSLGTAGAGISDLPRSGGKGIRVLAERSSPYAEIKVVDANLPGSSLSVRVMFIGHGPQTQKFLVDVPDRPPYYVDAFDLVEVFHSDPRRFLVIGLGGGALTEVLQRRPDTDRVDAVEIDADVVDLAREYFDFREVDPLRLHVMDARYYARRVASAGDVDLIFFDAFGAGTAPFHLFSVEALEEFRALLADGGVFVMNYLGFTSPGHRVGFHSAIRTVDAVFPHRRVLFGGRPSRKMNGFSNFLILGSDQPLGVRRSPFDHAGDPPRIERAARLVSIQGDPSGFPEAAELEAIVGLSLEELDRRLDIEIVPDEGELVTDDQNGLDVANVEQNDALRDLVFEDFRQVFVGR